MSGPFKEVEDYIHNAFYKIMKPSPKNLSVRQTANRTQWMGQNFSV